MWERPKGERRSCCNDLLLIRRLPSLTPDDEDEKEGRVSNKSEAIVPPSLQNGTSSRRDFLEELLLWSEDGRGGRLLLTLDLEARILARRFFFG